MKNTKEHKGTKSFGKPRLIPLQIQLLLAETFLRAPSAARKPGFTKYNDISADCDYINFYRFI